MNHSIFLLLLVFFLPLNILASEKIVPVHEDPTYALVFENEKFRILDIQLEAGESSWYHIHADPTIYVSLGWGVGRDQVHNGVGTRKVRAWPRGKVGSIYYDQLNTLTHQYKNTSDDFSRLISIINTDNGLDNPRIITSTLNKRPETENKWFRSYRHTIEPGESLKSHNHKSSVVVVMVTEGGFEVNVKKEAVFQSYDLGAWSFIEPNLEHRLINISDERIELIEVEIHTTESESDKEK